MQKKLVLLFCALICSNSIASAESNIDSLRMFHLPSVNVTTNRADEAHTATPFSEISKSEIQKSSSMQDLPKLMSTMPSILTYSENGNFIGYTNLSLRGFDQRRISVSVNGIPQNDPEDHNFYWINMSDIGASLDNIQIQRGAGLSNYGTAAIAGSINLSTSNFINEKGIKIYSGIGYQQNDFNKKYEQSSSKFSISYSSGLNDKYAFYAKLGRINSFGYRNQSWAYLNSYFFSAARFDEHLTTQINVYGGSQDDALAYTGLPKSYIQNDSLRRENYNYFSYDSTGKNVNWTTPRRNQEMESFTQPVIEILNDWNISENVEFKLATFYKNGQGYFDYDATGWTDATSLRLNKENGYPNSENPRNPIIRAYVANKTGGILPRFIYTHNNGILTLGTELRIHQSEHWGKIGFAENLPANYNPDYKFYSYNGGRTISSIFLREQYTGFEDLTISTEAQLIYQNYKINNEKTGNIFTKYRTIDNQTIGNGDDLFSINYLFFNPRLAINYKANEELNFYLSVALTSREPRMKNLYSAEESFYGAKPLFQSVIDTKDSTLKYDFTKPLVQPERMFNTELGFNFRNENLFLNLNLYMLDYFDELIKSGQLDILGSPIDGNAPQTLHLGAEIQATVNILESQYGDLKCGMNATYSYNRIVEYDLATESATKISLKDNKISGFPDFMANIRLMYEYSNFYCALSMKSVGEYYTDNYGTMIQNNPELIKFLGSEYYSDNIQDAFNILNLDFSYKLMKIASLNSLSLQFQVVNLANAKYSSGAIGKEFFPAAERQIFMGLEINY